MHKNIIVKQTGYKDCAVSCLLSIIRYYKGDISKEELSFIINTNDKGTSAYHMIEGMRKVGFDGSGRKLSLNELIDSEPNIPFIAHIQNQNYYHFIVIYEIDKKRKCFTAMDPAVGKRKITFEDFEKIYLGSILEFYVVSELPKLNEKESLLKLIKAVITFNIDSIIKVFILSIIITIITILNSFYYKIIIDRILIKEKISLLINITIVFITIILTKNILSFLRFKILINLKEKISRNITMKFIMHIFNLPYQYFKNKPTGEVISRINSINDLYDLILSIFLNLFVNSFLIIISLIVLSIINIKLTMVMFMIVLIYSIFTFVYSKIIRKKVFELKEMSSIYNQKLTEAIENYETVKNLDLINSFVNKIEVFYIKFLKTLKNVEIKLIKENYFKETIIDLCNLIILFLGSIYIMNNTLSLGELVLFIMLLSFYIEPFKELLNLITNYNYSLSSYERLNDLIRIKEEIINTEDESMIKGNIIFKNISYSFDKINKVIDNLNFEIKEGSKFLIHGKTGKGKSSLIKIILKYFKDYSGEIYINNINLKDIKKETIKNSFVYVSQNENLFSGTLKENIILDRKINDVYYEKIISICKVDEIRDKKLFRDNFLIEDSGFNISGGEKQRIILARALLNDFNYLVLDECLSEVDVLYEKEIIKNIKEFYKNKTIIYITHKEEIKTLFNERYEC